MAPRKKASKTSRSAKPSLARRLLPWLLKLGLVLLVAIGGYTVWLDAKVRTSLREHMYVAPAQVYARALHLYLEMPLAPEDLQRELDQLGYRKVKVLTQSGDVVRSGNSFQIYRRAFAFENGPQPAQVLKVFISGRSEERRVGRG